MTGRSTERPVLSEEQIERNVQGIKRILEDLISSGNGAGPAPQILNNLVRWHAEWIPVYQRESTLEMLSCSFFWVLNGLARLVNRRMHTRARPA